MKITSDQLQLHETKVHGHSKVIIYFNVAGTNRRLSLSYTGNGNRTANITTPDDRNLFKSIKHQDDVTIASDDLHERMRDKYSNVFSVMKPDLKLSKRCKDHRKQQLERLNQSNIDEITSYSIDELAELPHEYARVMAILYGFCGSNRYKVTFSEEVTPTGKRKPDREHDLKLFISPDNSLCVTAAKRKGHKVSSAPVTNIS
jgi:hypothetical protein